MGLFYVRASMFVRYVRAASLTSTDVSNSFRMSPRNRSLESVGLSSFFRPTGAPLASARDEAGGTYGVRVNLANNLCSQGLNYLS